MQLMFVSFIGWLVRLVLYVPFTMLKVVGLMLPACSTFGIVSFSIDVQKNIVYLIRFGWPILQYVPWGFFWNFASAILLYFFFKWMFGHLPKLMSMGKTFWIIVAVFYVLAAMINFFIGPGWQDSSAFSQVFGVGPNASNTVGGGFGGGGGESW